MKKIRLIENTYPVKLSCRNEEGIEASSLHKQKLEKNVSLSDLAHKSTARCFTSQKKNNNDTKKTGMCKSH